MLLYYLFWMFMGFTIHFYIIFGTNLLTGGPAQNYCFLPISEFRRKRISNGVQTEGNLRERDFWNEQDPTMELSMVSMDLTLLHCPFCLRPLKPPVYELRKHLVRSALGSPVSWITTSTTPSTPFSWTLPLSDLQGYVVTVGNMP